MNDWLLYLLSAAALAFAVSSWWGVRKLKDLHIRSAVNEVAHEAGLTHQRVVVILNPVKARAAEAKAAIQRACLTAGWDEPLFLETTAEDPGYSQAKAALELKPDVGLVGGGDGTVRVVAESLAHTDVAMGIIPLGTGNLLARNVHLDVNDLRASIQAALFGQQRYIDTARMGIENSRTGHFSEHLFLVIAGIGMDAEILADTNDGLKKAVGWLAYTEAGMRHLPGRRRKVSVSLDGSPEQVRNIRTVLFANCGLVPGGIDFIPEAMIDDGMLDVVVMSPRSALGWLAMYVKVHFKHRGNLPIMTMYRAGKIVVKCPEPMPTQVDGDPSGLATKVTVQVAPQSLLIRVKAQHS
jgi:diacylglycerol kinase family enzyme